MLSDLLKEDLELCTTLVQAVEDYFQDEEHKQKFEKWYKEKHGVDYKWQRKNPQ